MRPIPRPCLSSRSRQTDHAKLADLPESRLEVARLEAEIAREWEAYQELPKRKFVGARTQSVVYAEYVDQWRQKIERVGTANFPDEASQREEFGSVLVTVAIKADGTVERVEIDRSSGSRGPGCRGASGSSCWPRRSSRSPPTCGARPTSCTSPATGPSPAATLLLQMTDRYAVIGNPVAHSKSPLIHAEFARQTGQDIEYERLLAPLDGFRRHAWQDFRGAGGNGLNVTLPFKLEAFAAGASARSQRARGCGGRQHAQVRRATVSTATTPTASAWSATSKRNLGFRHRGQARAADGRRGRRSRASLGPLLAAHPAALLVANRTRGQGAAAWWSASAPQPRPRSAAREQLRRARRAAVRSGRQRDLGEPERHRPGLAARTVRAPAVLAYDMMYGKGLTPSWNWRSAQGAARLRRRPRHAGRAGRRILLHLARRAPADCVRSSRSSRSL